MADKKFTDLPAVTTLTDDDIFPLTDSPGGGAVTKKIVTSDLRTELKKGSIYPLEFGLNEGGGTLSTGPQVEAHIYEAGNITHWLVGGNHSTGLGINVYKAASWPVSPTGVPFLAMGFSNAISAENNSLALAVAVGDNLMFVNQKVNTVTRALVSMRILRT